MHRPVRLLTLPLVFVLPLLLSPSAGAMSLDFDALAPLSDIADAALPDLSVSSNLVVDEAAAADLTGFDTGAWATSGDTGLLNTLAPTIVFEFGTAIRSFEVDIVGLPAGGGVFQGVLAEAWRGDTLVDLAFSDVGLVGDSGFHEDALALSGDRIDRVTLTPATPTSCTADRFCFDLGPSTSVFLDSVRFEPVPEPGTGLLLFAGLVGLAGRRSRPTGARP